MLRGVSFEVAPGEAYGLVGESGCGKSTTAFAALRYLPSNGRITGGHVYVDGTDVTRMSNRELRGLRATRASMVYQDPGSALNPVLRIGPQVIECFTLLGQSNSAAEKNSLAALRHVRIADPERVMQRYPHQLSGGMQQRVVIAMALACDPQLLVLDEPTTGLDATVEAEVLDLVRALRVGDRRGDPADRPQPGRDPVDVRSGRRDVRRQGRRGGPAAAGLRPAQASRTPSACSTALPRHGVRKDEQAAGHHPGHAARRSAPRCRRACSSTAARSPPTSAVSRWRRWCSSPTIAGTRCHHADQVRAIWRPASSRTASRAVDSPPRSCSRCTTCPRRSASSATTCRRWSASTSDWRRARRSDSSASRARARRRWRRRCSASTPPTPAARSRSKGTASPGMTTNRTADERRAVQMIFQNPDSALNRNWTVRRILKRSVTKLTGLRGAAADKRVDELADSLRLSPRHLDLKPRQLSGGLKQRVAIARAFAGDPRIVVCDEPTSALDVSVQAAILNVLADLQAGDRTSYLFISHDLGVVRYLADRIAVMYLGRIMELGTTEQIFDGPAPPVHRGPAVGGAERRRRGQDSHPRSAARSRVPPTRPSGCVFHTRCHRVHRRPVRRGRAGDDRAGARAHLEVPSHGRATQPADRAERRRSGARSACVVESVRSVLDVLEAEPALDAEVAVGDRVVVRRA